MMNFEEFFEDIIGVTKPLHGSQKKMEESEDGFTFSIEVIPNYELNKKILSFGDGIQVLEPIKLRESIKEELVKTIEKYN